MSLLAACSRLSGQVEFSPINILLIHNSCAWFGFGLLLNAHYAQNPFSVNRGIARTFPRCDWQTKSRGIPGGTFPRFVELPNRRTTFSGRYLQDASALCDAKLINEKVCRAAFRLCVL